MKGVSAVTVWMEQRVYKKDRLSQAKIPSTFSIEKNTETGQAA